MPGRLADGWSRREDPRSVVDARVGEFCEGKHVPSNIADKAEMSVRQLERKFQEIYKTTPGQYLMRLRILRACEMLRSGLNPVTTIALDVGFYDHSAFSRKFSQLIGEPPSTYRKRFATKPGS